MADMEAEIALLRSMQAMSEAAEGYNPVGVAGADQKQSVPTEENDHLQPVKASPVPVHLDASEDASDVRLLSSIPGVETATSPSDPYQPATLTQISKGDEGSVSSSEHQQAPTPPSLIDSPPLAQGSTEPRMMAGFIVDDEDDDDRDPPTNPLAPGNANGPPDTASVDHTDGEAAAEGFPRTVFGASAGPPIEDVQTSPRSAFGASAGPPIEDVQTSPRSAFGASAGPPIEDVQTSPRSAFSASAGPPIEDVQTFQVVSENAIESTSPVVAGVDFNTASAKDPTPAAESNPTRSLSQGGPIRIPDIPKNFTKADHPSIGVSKARLPHDRVGILEDRIKEDPRGDMDAWLTLLSDHRRRNKFEDARALYERFFKIFPMAAEQWASYANMELANNDFFRVEQIFNKVLLQIPHLALWSLYLDYVRRRNNLTTDTTGQARTVLVQAYDTVLQHVGIDKDSGRIWHDYVQFLRAGPGNVGGSNWQDQQKMDQLRKVYQRAICIPTSAVNTLWKEYDAFEMGLNKLTGRKFLQQKSPAYMTARSANIELDNITRGLQRTTTPILPPAPGFEGDEAYQRQVELWKRWIQWEKDDALVLKDDDRPAYLARVVYVFKQATMALRFWPEMWFEAADFCFRNGLDKDGNQFLSQGIVANPESCLLAFKRADRLESTPSKDESDEGIQRRGAIIREPYDQVLDALYELIARAKAREARDVARVEENFDQHHSTPLSVDDDDREEEEDTREAAKNTQIKMIQEGSAVQIRMLSKMISFAWISLMRSMRRVQGKGKVGDAVGGSRQIFTDARKRGRLTSDVYVASALIEYHCYMDPAATKIFERGMKLFPEDENFALEYLKHLIAINDVTNARAVFEMTVNRLGQKPETLPKAKPVYSFFHEWESQYGERTQIVKLEKRMSTLFPDDPKLAHFSRRFTTNGFDPLALRPIISPAAQTRPMKIGPGLAPAAHTPPWPAIERAGSPKRGHPTDESDHEANRPRKLARGASPLKGAAGRRMDQQKRHQHQTHHHLHHPPPPLPHPQGHGVPGAANKGNGSTIPPPPAPLPREIALLLSVIPRAETYSPATRFHPEAMVRLLRGIHLPQHASPAYHPSGLPPPPPSMGMSAGLHHGLYPFTR